VATDVDGDNLSYMIVSDVSNGSTTIDGNEVTYTPNQHYNGTDSFTYKANDGNLDSVAVQVDITINNINDAPVANAQTVTLEEDDSVTFTISATDVDGDALTYQIVTDLFSGPFSGDESISGTTVVYVPTLNFSGNDSLKFTATDGTLTSNPAVVTLVVTPKNDPPTASPIIEDTNEDTPVTITLIGSDVDGSVSLTYQIVSQPTKGTLGTVNGNRVTYTPTEDYSGTDSFVYRVSDATSSATAVVSLTIVAINDVPTVEPLTLQTSEDMVLSNINLLGNDKDEDELTYFIATQPNAGSVTLTGAVATYTPDPNFAGVDVFSYYVKDKPAGAISDVANVTITVNPSNDTFYIEENPTNGALTLLQAGNTQTFYRYTPNQNFDAADNLTFYVVDAAGATSNFAVVDINIIASNDAPEADSQNVPTNEDVAVTITLQGSDAEDDANNISLTYLLQSYPENGSVVINGNQVIYTPKQDFNGSDQFEFVVRDSKNVQSFTSGLVSITVNKDNDPPALLTNRFTVLSGSTRTFTLDFIDVDDTAFTVTIDVDPQNGNLTFVSGYDYQYIPDSGFEGTDEVAITIDDGDDTTAETLLLVVVNTAIPTVTSSAVTIAEDSSTTIALMGNDADGGSASLVFFVAQATEDIAYQLVGNSLTIIPSIDFDESGTITFFVRDADGADSALGSIAITVTPENDVPTAMGDSIAVNEGSSLSFELIYDDVEDDTAALILTVVAMPSVGTLNVTDNVATYYANAVNTADQSFSFYVTDSDGATSNIAIVNIEVIEENDQPEVFPVSSTVVEDQSVVITLIGTDEEDNNAASLTYVIVVDPANGTADLSGNTVTYQPNDEFSGVDTFEYYVVDTQGVASENALVTITVTEFNDAPVAVDRTVPLSEDKAVTIELQAQDDEDASVDLTYSIVSNPTNGTLSFVTANSYLYTPNVNFDDADSFTFMVADTGGATDSAIITLQITPINDAPLVASDLYRFIRSETLTINLVASDIENGSSVTVTVDQPQSGALSGSSLTYNYYQNGTAISNFSYTASDGNLSSSAQIFLINYNVFVTNVTTNSARIEWTDISGYDSHLYLATSINGSYTEITTTDASTNHTFVALQSATEYFVKVNYSFNYNDQTLENDLLDVAAEAFATPFSNNLTGTVTTGAISSSTVELNWQGVNGASYYRLLRRDTLNGDPKEVYEGANLTFTDTLLNSLSTYYYQVRACVNQLLASCSNSYNNDTSGVLTKISPIQTFDSTLTATVDNYDINLSWQTDFNNFNHVQIYRSTDNSNFVLISSSTANSYIDNGWVDYMTTHYYKLRVCVDSSFDNCTSLNVVTATTAITPPNIYDHADFGTENTTLTFSNLDSFGNASAQGLWTDGETLWVSDQLSNPRKLFAYSIVYGIRDEAKDVDLDALQDTPLGIWSDGENFYVVQNQDQTIYAYNIATKARDSAKDITFSGPISNFWGLWANDNYFWVSSYNPDGVYAYDRNTLSRVPERDWQIPNNTDAAQNYSDGRYMWVVDDRKRDNSYDVNAFNLATGVSDSELSILDISHSQLRGGK